MFVVLVPANVYAAIEGVPLNGDPATPLWLRIPEQIVYITIALWATRPVGPPRITARGRRPCGPPKRVASENASGTP
ncbi:hypothetical protein AAH991_31320 [Microbispora sp. ZYX-F-249]|uniref:Uncharacterized protein n=1 Tax=Microbispora maris TaxID=3144104 RepID=A0ABV0AZC2_9ACTN